MVLTVGRAGFLAAVLLLGAEDVLAAKLSRSGFFDLLSAALYSDDPLGDLEALKEEAAQDSVEGLQHPENVVQSAKAYYASLSGPLLVVYEREKRFREGHADTIFAASSADLTGDSEPDQIIARVEKVDLRVYVTHVMVSGDDTTTISRYWVAMPDSPGPVPLLHEAYRVGISCGQRPEFRNPRDFLSSVSVMVQDVAKYSGEGTAELTDSVSQYLQVFSGEAICTSNGASGACRVYYRPQDRFALLYTP